MTAVGLTRAKPTLVTELETGVIYQVYVRSFKDGNGDGIGDLAGLTSELDRIADLGCDAIWLNPCYASPQADHGYDIADYFNIDADYGTLSDFDAMVEKAHSLGLRVLMDLVANHCSVEHPWFVAALQTEPGSPERMRFHFSDGSGAHGEQPPGNWQSVFGGSAWTRVHERDGRPGQWYLHLFDEGQPDFNWRNPEVWDYFQRVLTFWFDRGVDGFRIDVAHGNVKAEGLPDLPETDGSAAASYNDAMWDQPEVHDIYRSWRRVADSYDEARYFVGEIWVPSAKSLRQYLRSDELHQAFSFDLLVQPWNASRIRQAIIAGMEIAGGRPAWALANHDVHRSVTRYGQHQFLEDVDPSDMISAARRTGPVDVALGVQRARAALALVLALPGSAYLYQGEELGLPEALELPDDARQDPIWKRSDGKELGRDGCRVPLPWAPLEPHYGFGAGAESNSTWLPQPDWFKEYSRDLQERDIDSILNFYRRAIHLRKQYIDPATELEWQRTSDDVLAFRRGNVLCVTNFGSSIYNPPQEWGTAKPIIASNSSGDGIETDTTTWLSLSS